jgi:hypothetical protein
MLKIASKVASDPIHDDLLTDESDLQELANWMP